MLELFNQLINCKLLIHSLIQMNLFYYFSAHSSDPPDAGRAPSNRLRWRSIIEEQLRGQRCRQLILMAQLREYWPLYYYRTSR